MYFVLYIPEKAMIYVELSFFAFIKYDGGGLKGYAVVANTIIVFGSGVYFRGGVVKLL